MEHTVCVWYRHVDRDISTWIKRATETVQLYQEKNWKNVKNGGFMMINSWNRFSAGFLMDCSWVYDGYTPQTQWQVPINPLLGLGCLIKGTTSVAGEKYVRVTTELYNQPGVYRYPGLTVWKRVALWFFWEWYGCVTAMTGDVFLGYPTYLWSWLPGLPEDRKWWGWVEIQKTQKLRLD